MERIDERVLDIEKADFMTKFEYNQALRTNVVKRILNTPDEKFDLITNNCVLLKINDNIKITLHKVNDDVVINIYQDDSIIRSFLCTVSVWYKLKEREAEDSDLLPNKIESIRKIKLKITEESEKYMPDSTKKFYAVFDAISSDFE